MSRRLVTGLFACVVSVALVACTNAPSAPPTESPQPPAQPAAPTEPTKAPAVAVLSIASVDVDARNVTVAGFVTQIAEDGGRCSFVFTSGISGAEVTVETAGIANVDTTSCGTVQVPVSELSRGPWEVHLEYRSDELESNSEPITVEVP